MKRNFAIVFLLLVLAQARASELFIWISTPGTFEVTVGDQFQKSTKGKFRFFDLDSGYVSIRVKKQGSSGAFYEGRVRIQPSKCMVVEIGQNDLYHVSAVDCSGNYELPSGDAVVSNQPNSTDYSKYQSTDQGNDRKDSSKTDYSKYHGTDQGNNYHNITDPDNKQDDPNKTDYSKYHSTDQGNGQKDSSKTDYSKYHGTDQGNNYHSINDPGNKQDDPGKTDYSKYQNTDQGKDPNKSNKTDQGKQNNADKGKGQSDLNKTDYSQYQNTDQGKEPNKSNKTDQGKNKDKPNKADPDNFREIIEDNDQDDHSNKPVNNNKHNNSNNSTYDNYHNNGYDEKSFNETLAVIRSKTFDSQKLEQAKAFVPTAHYTSAQVKRICELMNFDSNKLEFAKFAYDYAADKDNYSQVKKVFRMSIFSKELDKYINSKH